MTLPYNHFDFSFRMRVGTFSKNELSSIPIPFSNRITAIWSNGDRRRRTMVHYPDFRWFIAFSTVLNHQNRWNLIHFTVCILLRHGAQKAAWNHQHSIAARAVVQDSSDLSAVMFANHLNVTRSILWIKYHKAPVKKKLFINNRSCLNQAWIKQWKCQNKSRWAAPNVTTYIIQW